VTIDASSFGQRLLTVFGVAEIAMPEVFVKRNTFYETLKRFFYNF
jgi:hypothetical protein